MYVTAAYKGRGAFPGADAALSLLTASDAPVASAQGLRGVHPARAAQGCNLWLGSDGAAATLHYDQEHNFVLQLRGERRFTLVRARSRLEF